MELSENVWYISFDVTEIFWFRCFFSYLGRKYEFFNLK